jgi:ELWxxDGT repeat protein
MARTRIQASLRRLALVGAASALMLSTALPVSAAHGGSAALVKDINTGTGGSRPSGLTAAGKLVFFSALGAGGRELYRTNGTTAGTARLSIRPGSRGALPAHITAFGTKVLFSAHDGSSGRELWISDGTSAGTRRVKDIRPGSKGSAPRGLVVMGGKVYFSANDGQRGRELWVTNGTANGTRLVRDIKAGAKGSDPMDLVAVGPRLFFSARASRSLWVSDGTSSGTRAFPNSSNLSDVRQLTRAGDKLFFVGTTSVDLLTSKTSLRVVRSGATRSVKLLDVSSDNCPNVSYCRETLDMVPVGSSLFVTGPTRRLWRTDGTSAGTIKLKDLNDCGAKAGRYNDCSYAGAFTDVSGKLYFVLPQYAYSAETGTHRSDTDQVWMSDGTVAGTRMVKVFEQPSRGGWNAPGAAIALNGVYYFTGYEAGSGFELWRSDGTSVGTTLVHEINTTGFDGGWAFPSNMAVLAGSLLMSADDGSHGPELWRLVP